MRFFDSAQHDTNHVPDSAGFVGYGYKQHFSVLKQITLFSSGNAESWPLQSAPSNLRQWCVFCCLKKCGQNLQILISVICSYTNLFMLLFFFFTIKQFLSRTLDITRFLLLSSYFNNEELQKACPPLSPDLWNTFKHNSKYTANFLILLTVYCLAAENMHVF